MEDVAHITTWAVNKAQIADSKRGREYWALVGLKYYLLAYCKAR